MNINKFNKGGSALSDIFATNYHYEQDNVDIESTTLENIIKENNINNIKLLKIDCEGSEYEILYNTPKEILNLIKYMRGEFHENKELTNKYDINSLKKYCQELNIDIEIIEGKKCFVID